MLFIGVMTQIGRSGGVACKACVVQYVGQGKKRERMTSVHGAALAGREEAQCLRNSPIQRRCGPERVMRSSCVTATHSSDATRAIFLASTAVGFTR